VEEEVVDVGPELADHERYGVDAYVDAPLVGGIIISRYSGIRSDHGSFSAELQYGRSTFHSAGTKVSTYAINCIASSRALVRLCLSIGMRSFIPQV
jgi:hypothetical protein